MSRNHPIRHLIIFGMLLIAAIIVGTAIMVDKFRESKLADNERELGRTALLLAEHTDQMLQSVELVQIAIIERIQLLGITSGEELERQMSSEDVHLKFKYRISGLQQIDVLSLVNADGELINFSRFWPIPRINLADREYFKALKSNPHLTSIVSEPLRNRSTGAWTIVLARKVTAPNGDLLGLLLGGIELSYFETFFESLTLGKDAAITMFHRDGTLLARHPHTESLIGKNYKTGPLFQNILLKADHGTMRLDSRIDSQNRLVAARGLRHFPAAIVAAVTVSAALADWWEQTKILTGVAGISTFVIAIMFFLIVQQMSREHERSKQSLALEKLRLNTAINNMSQGLLMFDANARLVLCNERYIDMYRLSPETVKPGCTFLDLVTHRYETGSIQEDPQQYCSDVLNGIAKGMVSSQTAETADGRTIQTVSTPMATGGWVATHEDITESTQREASFRLLFEGNPVPMWVHDLGSLRFLAVNNAAIAHYGYSRAQFLTMGLFDIRPLEEREKVTQWLQKTGGTYHGEQIWRHQKSDGTEIEVVVYSQALNYEKHLAALVAIIDATERKQVERERDRDREFLTRIIDNVPVSIIVKDATSRRIVLANREAEAIWGFPRAEALGRTARELFQAAQADLIDSYDGEALRSDTALVLDAHQNMARSGDIRTMTSKRFAIRDNDGKPIFLISVVEDVTKRKLLEQERDRDREFLHQIVSNVPTTIVVKNVSDRRYILINQAGEKYFGLSRDQIIGKTAQEVWSKETADTIVGHDEQLLQSNGNLFFDEHSVTKSGKGTLIVTSKRVVIRDGKGEPQYLLGVIDDVTERRRSEERIVYLAHYDALTDLPNRVLFHERLENSLKWVRRGELLALLCLDFDYFKSVNDTFGHPVGDELLKAVAARLRGCIRKTDIVARLGGDEFAIVQNGIAGPTDVVDLVNRIQKAIREPYEAGGHQLVGDISIGIALAPDDGTNSDQLLKNADLAMYGAKDDGRGTYRFFEQEMGSRATARRALEFDLRQAIMDDQFELHYQPLVNLGDNKVSGCEALLRWRHPERGMISPAEFIPLAEETGLVNQLGEWVLRTACAEAATWPDDIKIAVNVSPVQFKSQTLALTVIGALAASGLPARRLELEITETVLICDDEAALVVLHQLRELGVRIVLDDFGTGYSSLSYLHRFVFDKIKIDHFFIKNIAEKDGSLAIVQAVVTIAKSINITTVAEGVETEQQRELLRTLGCTEMQGYLFSPAIPAVEISQLLLSRSERAVGAA